jgi:succinylarginine dihydrolase
MRRLSQRRDRRRQSDVLLLHEQAFVDNVALAALRRDSQRWGEMIGARSVVVVTARDFSDAVSTYLFNAVAQRPDGSMVLVAPAECGANVSDYLDELTGGSGPVREVLTFDLRQSMRNGGGPACLRLRVVLDHRCAVHGAAERVDRRCAARRARVVDHSPLPDRLSPADLGDPLLLDR